MYKNGIPAEYLVRQALRERAGNYPTADQMCDCRQDRSKRELIPRSEMVLPAQAFPTPFKDYRNAV